MENNKTVLFNCKKKNNKKNKQTNKQNKNALQLRSTDVEVLKGSLAGKYLYIRQYVSVCVEVLRPSQPNGVMSSAVSLPNHTFTGQS